MLSERARSLTGVKLCNATCNSFKRIHNKCFKTTSFHFTIIKIPFLQCILSIITLMAESIIILTDYSILVVFVNRPYVTCIANVFITCHVYNLPPEFNFTGESILSLPHHRTCISGSSMSLFRRFNLPQIVKKATI